jgi:hypothetical protein
LEDYAATYCCEFYSPPMQPHVSCVFDGSSTIKVVATNPFAFTLAPGDLARVEANPAKRERWIELYTHSLNLAEGDHVLHLGVFARTAAAPEWAGGGKIEVAGLLDPTFPMFDDDRPTVRYPLCQETEGFSTSCPGGEAFWVDLPLHVAVGKVRRPSPTTGLG